MRTDGRGGHGAEGRRIQSVGVLHAHSGAKAGDRCDRCRRVLRRRSQPVPADRRVLADQRRVPGPGRLRIVRRGIRASCANLPRRPGWLGAHVDPQCGSLRVLLFGPGDAAVLRGDLASAAGASLTSGVFLLRLRRPCAGGRTTKENRRARSAHPPVPAAGASGDFTLASLLQAASECCAETGSSSFFWA